MTMSTSRFIKILEEHMARHGDVPVVMWVEGMGGMSEGSYYEVRTRCFTDNYYMNSYRAKGYSYHCLLTIVASRD